MDEMPLSEADARNLRFLRRLVLVLTTTMIVGMVVVIVLLAMRLSGPSDGGVATPQALLPESLVLPEGVAVLAVTRGPDWWAVVTADDQILIYDASGGTLRQQVDVR